MMNWDELAEILIESNPDLTEALLQNMLRGIKYNHEKIHSKNV
jgi:hypothetical protein